LSGNITNVTDETLYTFTVKAQDLELQDTQRTFSLQYFLDFVARKLIASDKAASDSFGYSVSMNSDGSRVVIGAGAADPGGTTDAGAAYVFSRSGINWTQEFKLTASDKAASDYFGQSVSMNSDGSRVVVGAYGADPGGTTDAGAAYVCGYSNGVWLSY
jgi:uridylate kinase